MQGDVLAPLISSLQVDTIGKECLEEAKHLYHYKDLVPTFVSILKQVIERRLPKDFDYHKVPAPWMQVKLLKIMSLLGADDQSSSESMCTDLDTLFPRNLHL